MAEASGASRGSIMTVDFAGAVGRALRRVALPLAMYYAVTVAVPLANGAVLSGMFVRHTLVVVLVPPVLIALLSVLWAGSRAAIAVRWRCGSRTADTCGNHGAS